MDTDLHRNSAACYDALRARDARFDGHFFVGVTSTGIYCRPVCRVRTPKAENCRFFHLAAQAEHAGFRPCLRCRPELAPAQRHWSSVDAGDCLLRSAMQWLDHPGHWSAGQAGIRTMLQSLSGHLGVTDRHLRRLFGTRLGISPLQYLQTRRLLPAKQLLTDTSLPMAQIALASGFGSVRRFNEVFRCAYGLQPTALRRHPDQADCPPASTRSVVLHWRSPMNVASMMAFLGDRQLVGHEAMIHGPQPGILKAIRLPTREGSATGWIRVRFVAERHGVILEVSPHLWQELPQIIWRTRHWLDLDVDITQVDAVLDEDFPSGNGHRLPGSFDGFEAGVRAILGQQVTLAAGNTIAARLVAQWGTPVDTPSSLVSLTFPDPETLADADPARMGALGITKQRQAAIVALSRACADGDLRLEPGGDADATVAQLMALPGIGPWTAQYIAMRALHWSDAWLPGDAAVRNALRSRETPQSPDQMAQRWRPWRSYAVVRAWAAGTSTRNRHDTA
ncbi:MAG: DNA-3-methyladenine glycosylase 2 family protein [Gammaproteobacteria bacterium]